MSRQLDARGYYEEFEHPITDAHRYPVAVRITPGPARITARPRQRSAHNDEILRGLASPTRTWPNCVATVIGERVLNA